ncbi:PREDICTED: WD repeat-containing protein 89 homolog [Theobroma cacao]|uniref:WD repeat-containing protein 89 homolog n=1 Tax=Theobroma cacao TaxID=3641 RepID=A0AB32VRP5_THECC|nr:PREDICTED: WD repeat-containing protein 89 homolog [Theobroma cacao]
MRPSPALPWVFSIAKAQSSANIETREMEEASEMEVEEQKQPVQNNQSSTKRFGLKNSIQTNFGDDYVFQIVPKDDWASMAVSLSTNAVKLYSPMTGQYFGECKGHTSTINHISFSGPSTPHTLHSSSSDGTIRAWDTRTFHQVSCITAGSSQEVFSFSFGGSDDNLLAAGCQSQIFFWDWRNKKQVACLEESHVEDVTQVHFIPGHQNKLASASADGLICTFDTNGDINDDDHLESVINVGTSIGKVGFFGESYEKLWCLTNIETLSVWNWKDGSNEANFEDARSLASDSWTLDHVDYFVDCHCFGGENLWVIGGTNAGSLGYFPVIYKGAAAIGPPEAVLGGGHMGVVRSILPMSSMRSGPAQSQGIFGWTGGEDGRLCCWMADDSSEINRSWISSALVMKSPRNRKRSRHNPY